MLRPAKIRQYLAAMKARGFEARAVLAGSNISAAQLDDAGSFIDLEQCRRVIANIVELTGNPGIGFEFGSTSQLTDLGIVGYAMASSRTLRQAVSLFFSYANSSIGLPIRIVLFDRDDGTWGVSASSTAGSELLFKFYFEEVLGMGLALTPALTGETFVVKELQVTFAGPAGTSPYHGGVAGRVSFRAAQNIAIVSKPGLETPLRWNDDWVNELCLRHCSRIMSHSNRIGPTASLVRSLLLQNRHSLKLGDAARQLNMSSRTLRRRLSAEDSAFQTLLDEFRHHLAQEYLDTRLISVKEIAGILGFTRPDAFGRAFKSWNGRTIREYRAAARSAA